MSRKIGLLLAAAALLALLAGCASRSLDELYTPPKPASDYQQLDAKIKEALAGGAEYSAPVQGTYTQQVQLIDLDEDGVQEALAFFRVSQPAEGELPLKIYIYRRDEAGDYQVSTVIEGEGTGISSITYVELDGNADRELVVSWQISAKIYQLVAYDLRGEKAVELMRTGGYTEYVIQDLDMDNRQEVVILTINPDVDQFQADYYDYEDMEGTMVLRSSAQLSAGVSGLADTMDRAPRTYLREGIPAIFVALSTKNPTDGYFTDILALREGVLTNITRNEASGQSDGTFRQIGAGGNLRVPARDINGDGVIEVPTPHAMPPVDPLVAVGSFWRVAWVQYDIQGQGWPVSDTYYCQEDGWYLVLPEEWGDRLVMGRADRVAGERAVVFYYAPRGEDDHAERFLTIYTLTGPNRGARSKMTGRFVLRTESDTIYAAEFTETGGWDCGLDETNLAERFRLIQPVWNLS